MTHRGGSLDRRSFLRRMAAGVAASGADSAAAAAPRLSLGFSLYGMKSVPLEQALKACSETGYRNVELCLLPGYPTEPSVLATSDRARLRSQLAANRLTVSALLDNLSLVADEATHAANLERLRAAGELAHALAPEAPPVFETVLGGRPAEWDTVRDRMAERLRDWARVAARVNLTLCLKAHVSSAVCTPERLLWLHEQAGSAHVRLAYDFSHFDAQGLDLEATMRALLPRTRFIHVKDAVTEAGKVRFLLPGEGRTDYARYGALLRELAWSGPVVVEVSGMIFNQPGYDPLAAARACYGRLAAKLLPPASSGLSPSAGPVFV